MTRWLSRRHPRYVRSLVYMLQASEYEIWHFLKWHERVQDFRTIEHRKHLVFTPKAIMLFAAGWTILLLTYAAAIFFFLNATEWWHYLLALALALESPLFVLCALVVGVIKLRVLQIPVEGFLVSQARERLATHPGLKIAIAGSYGKTSTREILKTVLSEGKKVAAPGGSHNTPLAIAQFVKTLKGDEEVIIFELGEYYSGDVRKLCRMIQPQMGIITGVNEAHLEKFKTLEKATATVFELADFLGGKPLYVNGENERARAEASEEHIIYTRKGAGEWRVEEAKAGIDGTTLTLGHTSVRITCTSKLLGLHMVGPLALAADIGSRCGLTPEQIRHGIEKTKPFEHRLEPKFGEDGVVTLDDSYNGSPDGVRAIIEFLATLSGRRWYVTPGLVEMGARIEVVHKEIGAQLARAGIEKTVLIRNSVTPFIEKGLQEAGYKGEVIWFDDALTAYAAIPRMTVKGDIVLLQNDWPDQYF